MATAERATGGWTYQKYLELEDEARHEIIEGELIMVPAPGTAHQEIASRLFLRLASFVLERSLGKALFAPVDVVLGEAETDVVQPDLLFIRKENLGIVEPQAIRGVPDLVMEILSPSSLHRDRHQKRDLYARAGVPEYWIVDPANRAIEVLALGERGYELASAAAGSGAVASRVLPGFAVAVAEVMAE